MGLPLSVLETVLHPKEDLLVFTVPGEDRPTMVYPSQLKDLYIQTRMELNKCRKALESTSAKLSVIIEKERKKVERKSEEESKVSSEQEVETVCTPSISKPKRTRRNNKNKTEKV